MNRKKVRMKDIADKLGISVNAVSLALNNKVGVSDETRMKVLTAADAMGYLDQIKNPDKRKHLNSICVMLEEKVFKDTRFYPKVILGIEKEAKKNKYETTIHFINRDKYDIPLSIERGKAEGILVLGYISDEYLKLLKSYRIPIVLVDHASLSVITGAVMTQNYFGAYTAAEYLVHNGHRSIGFIGDIKIARSFYERWMGFNDALKTRNIPIQNEFCFTENVEENVLKNNFQAFVDALNSLKRFPTAWFCANDSTAFVLINALKVLGKRIPDDISVMGFDDIDICSMTEPRLTTMHVETEEMGATAVRELLFKVNNADYIQRHVRLPVRLVERDSVRLINGGQI